MNPNRSRWRPERTRRLSLGALGGVLALGAIATSSGSLLALDAAPVTAGVPPSTGTYAVLNPVTGITAATFADPPNGNKPWVRWNPLPNDPATTNASLVADLQDMAAHNIGGVEIGQGGVMSTDQLTLVYNTAAQLGITVSLKAASALPGGLPYATTDNYARRTLSFSRLDPVTAGATVDVDVPGTSTGTIAAVVAYRCTTAGCPNLSGGVVSLVRDSAVDLTGTLTATNANGYNGGSTAGHLNWTAPSTPAGTSWLVTVYRAVPFGTTPETLSTQGTKEVTDAYDTYFAGALGNLVKANAGDFFVDSHAGDPWGVPQELWSSNMKSEFAARAGYDLVPNLAALVDTTMVAGLTTTYTFSDGSANRIRSDFSKVRSDLYTQNRIVPFQTWAHGYNMKLRLQQEDIPTTAGGDQIQTSIALDRSEHESLIGSDQTDTYRSMASGNHMTGNSWFSTECCAVLNESWAQTTGDYVVRMNHEFAGGVNKIVYHTRPSVATSTSTWPGPVYNGGNGKVGFSNSYNSQQPYYTDSAAYNDYFARNNEVLTQGATKMDVAVYLRNYSDPAAFGTTDPTNKHWQDTALQRAGYTWDYYDESSMDLPNATVSNAHLAADGPNYSAIVFDQFLQPSVSTTRGTLTVKAANKMLDYAKAGLPVIFVGNPQSTGTFPATTDADLASTLTQLRAQPTFSSVPSEAAVPAKLKSLGVTPAAQTKQPGPVMSVRREDTATGTNYYWLYNMGVDAYPGSTSTYGQNPSNLYEEPEACRTTGSVLNPCMATGDAVDTTISLQGAGVPVLLDTWSGKITPISEYSRTGNGVTVDLHLARDASEVVALTTNPATFGVAVPGDHVVSTTADGVVARGDTLLVKASADGDYTTTVDNGAQVRSTVTGTPAAVNLTGNTWSLAVEDWQPAAPYGTVGVAGSETAKPVVSTTISALKPWTEIPAVKDASGVGTYTTTFALPTGWAPSAQGASLDLGQVTDSFRVTVNGTEVPVDQVSGRVDVSDQLHAGVNTLVVRVATTLNNRLASLDTAVKNRGLTQRYGLVGPVVLTPYQLVQVYPAVSTPTPGATALRSVAAPTLKGKAKVGRKLRVDPGSWSPAATSYSYTWLRNGKPISSAHGATWKVKRRDLGTKLSVTVTAAHPGYASGVATSNAVKVKRSHRKR